MPTLASSASASSLASARGRRCTWTGASTRFSSTVMWDQRLKVWKTMPSRARMRSTWCLSAGTRPRRVVEKAMGSPATVIPPSSGTSSRLRQRRNVLLPEPDEPMIAITSPVRASSEMPRSTSSAPNRLRIALAAMAVPSCRTCAPPRYRCRSRQKPSHAARPRIVVSSAAQGGPTPRATGDRGDRATGDCALTRSAR